MPIKDETYNPLLVNGEINLPFLRSKRLSLQQALQEDITVWIGNML